MRTDGRTSQMRLIYIFCDLTRTRLKILPLIGNYIILFSSNIYKVWSSRLLPDIVRFSPNLVFIYRFLYNSSISNCKEKRLWGIRADTFRQTNGRDGDRRRFSLLTWTHLKSININTWTFFIVHVLLHCVWIATKYSDYVTFCITIFYSMV